MQFLGNGQSGKASVRALSGGAASDPLELSVGAGAAGRVNLTANPTSVPASGGTTTITANVFDASGNPLSSVPVTFTHDCGIIQRASGQYRLCGTCIDEPDDVSRGDGHSDGGGTTSAGLTISVSVRPSVSISLASGSIPVEGGITTFSVTVNTATGGAPLESVVVSYGDGLSDDLGAVSGTVAVQHIYSDSGSFTPSVTATDTAGSSATSSTVIVVQPMLVSITATQSISSPTTFTFTANVSPAGTSVASYTWTFGDGAGVTTSSASATHTYTVSGDKIVRVTVRTPTNVTGTGSTNITVP